MRVLVYPHSLSIGGSQINAIDLGAAVAAAGHDVTVYGIEGPLVDLVEQRGLEYVPARRLRYRPAPSRIAQLWSLSHRRRFDVIHAYEWPPCLDAYFGAHLFGRIPLVCTVLSMSVSPLVPDSVPLVMGTQELGAVARRQRTRVFVLEPPIDVETDHPGVDGRSFRAATAVSDDEVLVVTVSRLSIELKLDALTEAVDAAEILSHRLPVRLVIVGDGDARSRLEARASAVNRRAGRTVVALTGAMEDPRPAYAGADIVVGMGGSALRGAAFGNPVVVQGEAGFSLPLKPETLETFIWQGFWGVGNGSDHGRTLADQIEPLVVDTRLRGELGAFARQTAVDRFSLTRARERILALYREAITDSRTVRPSVREAVTIGARAFGLEVHQHRPSVKRANAAERRARLDRAGRRLGAPADES